MFQHFVIDAVFVLVATLGLLPAEVYKNVLRVADFSPVAPVRHDPPHQVRVISHSQAILSKLGVTFLFSSGWSFDDDTGCLSLVSVIYRGLGSRMLRFLRDGCFGGDFL